MTLEEVRSYFNANEPQREVAYLFLFLGNSMVNGYSCTLSQTYPTSVIPYYFGTNPITKYKRGTSTEYSAFWIYEDYSEATTYGNIVIAMIHNYDNALKEGFDIYGIQSAPNGVSIIPGEQSKTWSPLDADNYYDDLKVNLDRFIKYKAYTGVDIVIAGVNFAHHVVGTGGYLKQDYKDAMSQIYNTIRTDYGTQIKFVWLAIEADFTEAIACREACIELKSELSDWDYFDMQGFPIANDELHPRATTVRHFGMFVASKWYQQMIGGTMPTVSNVAIQGIIKVDQYLTASYDYSGGTESITEIIFETADDASGTNKILHSAHYKGESVKILSPYVGKYIRACVVPKQMNKPYVGQGIAGSWEGPIAPL